MGTREVLGLALLAAAGCERLAPGTVGQGVSRLAIRNFATIAELVNADAGCGFESPAVKAGPETIGTIGAEGTLRWRVEGCIIDLPEPLVREDCNGTRTTISGRLLVDATREVYGILTGNPEQPVIPTGPDAVTLRIDRARYEDFAVASSASDAVLTLRWGAISGVLRPRLAVDDSLGACSVPTTNALLSDVVFEPSLAHVKTESRDFEVEVNASRLEAVHGRYGERENALTGEITVWGSEQAIPTDEDERALDPDYDPDRLARSFSCAKGLASPLSYDCKAFLGPRLAQSAARLSIRVMARVGGALDADERCGFASEPVKKNAMMSGVPGGQGSVLLRAERCALDFPAGTVLVRTCDGIESVVRGKLVVSGTKRVSGRLTGDLDTPVIPMRDDPAELELRIESFEGFEVAENGATVEVLGGTFAGRMTPRVAQDLAQAGACGFVTDIVRFSDVKWTPGAKLRIGSAAGKFDVSVEGADLEAVSGRWGADTNALSGAISLDGQSYALPVDPADPGLVPGYEQAAFDASWQCGSLQLPVSHDCHFTRPLAQGTAQLSIQMLGTLA